MRKIIFLLLLVLFTFSSFSQKALIYSKVIQAEGISQNELYNRAKLWFADAFKSSKDVLQIESKEDGQLIGKALIIYEPSFASGVASTGTVRFSVSVLVKEGRFKYEFKDFVHESRNTSFGSITTAKEYPRKRRPKSWNNKVWEDIKFRIDRTISPSINQLKRTMIAKKNSKDDDW